MFWFVCPIAAPALYITCQMSAAEILTWEFRSCIKLYAYGSCFAVQVVLTNSYCDAGCKRPS